jgi:hypothetical protein
MLFFSSGPLLSVHLWAGYTQGRADKMHVVGTRGLFSPRATGRRFLKPSKKPGIEIVWRVGEEHEVEWECDFTFLNIRLWQEDPTRGTARPGGTVFGENLPGI